MPRRPSAALLAALALCAAPTGLAAPPPPPLASGAASGPLAISLHAAATATGDEWAAALAEAPVRSAQALRDTATAAFASLVPEAPLARARAGLVQLETWRARARTVAQIGATLRRLAAAAGGPVAAGDRALDAAAGLAVTVFALRLALRGRATPGQDPGRMRWAATD